MVWSNETYPAGDLTSPTYNIGGVEIVVTTTGDTSFLTGTTPLISTKNQGGEPVGTEALEFSVNYPDRNRELTITVTFDELVTDVAFTIFDIDVGGGSAPFSFVDEVTVTGVDENNMTINPTTITGSPNNMVSGNVITGTIGTPNTGPGSGLANASITFADPIQSFTFVYGSGSNAINNPTPQSISLYDIVFTPVIPEPRVYAAAAFLLCCLGGHWWQRRRRLTTSPPPASSRE